MSATNTEQLVLASSSPRRRELLAEAGYRFALDEPKLDEPTDPLGRLAPRQAAEALAYFKVRSVADSRDQGEWVLGADTIVAGPGGMGIVGKPVDVDDARRILQKLSGSRHAVITGVALVAAKGRRRIASDVTWVTMKPMTPDELEAYLDSGQWQGKAGAYGIQGRADAFVTKLEGSYSNVVGLPMELLDRLLGGLDAREQG